MKYGEGRNKTFLASIDRNIKFDEYIIKQHNKVGRKLVYVDLKT